VNRRPLRNALIAALLTFIAFAPYYWLPNEATVTFHHAASPVTPQTLGVFGDLAIGFALPMRLLLELLRAITPSLYCLNAAPVLTDFMRTLLAAILLTSLIERLRQSERRLVERIFLALTQLAIAAFSVYGFYHYAPRPLMELRELSKTSASFSTWLFLLTAAYLPGAIFWFAYSLRALARLAAPERPSPSLLKTHAPLLTLCVLYFVATASYYRLTRPAPLPQSPAAPEASPLPPHAQHSSEK